MTIQTNTTDRKALAKAIADALHTEYSYLGTPTYAYEVGGYTIDRYGIITGDDFTPIHGLLVANGYIEAEPDVTAGVEDGEATVEDVNPDTVEESRREPESDASEDEANNTDSEASASMLSTIDTQTITIPAPDMTVEQLRNLTYILYSRQRILNLMVGGDTIHIPLELIEALKEALPATPEDFSTLLDSFREIGLEGFDFKDGKFTLVFPFYETEPTKWTTFAGLQGRILQAAREATRVFPELIQPEEEAEKYTAHMWLQRLGYKGQEMKAQRNTLLKHLHGYCAFSNGVKMQSHKDKYGTIRREHREAERAAAQTIVVPITSEAEMTVPADVEEVTDND